MVKNKIFSGLVYFVIVVLAGNALLSIGNAQALSSPSVRIGEPGNKEIVDGYRITVRGSSAGLETESLHIYIMVHPIQTSLVWVQPPPNIDREGNWIARIYVGEPKVGNNQKYAIRAIVTTETLYQGKIFKMNEFPSCIAEHQIIVTRKDKTILSTILSTMGLTTIGIILTMFSGWIGYRKWKI